VNQALADLKEDGELQEITDQWMGGQAGAPELQ
jgi:ABC-type amino acid transport substrate-binding protein